MKLLTTLVLAAALLACASAGREISKKWRKPEFCGHADCPRFKTEDKTDNYDIRTYEKSKWVTTYVNDTKYELAYPKGTSRLMKYFKGSNDKEETMDLTTPTLVSMRMEKPQGLKGDTERCYGFSYWLPEEFQEDPPQPADGEVKIVEYDEVSVYVRVFSGFATEGSIVKEAESLHSILKDDDRDFDDTEVFVAVYDPPTKLLKRHNEIHVPVEGKKKPAVTVA